ncbi:MAG: ArsR family transcriptional regulator [Zestosphaera sp.]
MVRVVFSRGEANLNQIIRETRLNHRSVTNHLKYLVSVGLVEEIRVGRLRLFRPNWLNPKARRLEELLTLF